MTNEAATRSSDRLVYSGLWQSYARLRISNENTVLNDAFDASAIGIRREGRPTLAPQRRNAASAQQIVGQQSAVPH